MAHDSGIDPRYAAQFQRGYDPVVHAAPEPTRVSGPVRLAGGPPTSAPRVPDPPRLPTGEGDTPARQPEVEAPREAPASAPPAFDRAQLVLAAALIVVGFATFVAGAAPSEDFTQYDARAELVRLALRNVAGPLFAGAVVVLGLAFAPRLAAHRFGQWVFAAAALALVVFGLVAVVGAADEVAVTQEYWLTGNPSHAQQAAISRAQNVASGVTSMVPWLLGAAVALAVLAVRLRGRGQAGSASATASRDA